MTEKTSARSERGPAFPPRYVVDGFGKLAREEDRIPLTLARTYVEHQQLRRILAAYSRAPRFLHGLDFGAGYGRMTPVVAEFCHNTFLAERDSDLCGIARACCPQALAENVRTLSQTSYPTGFFTLALSFTVLQHIPDSEIERVCQELRRVMAPGGLLILCEETNLYNRHLATQDRHGTTGRSASTYAGLLGKVQTLGIEPRQLEACHPDRNGGAYMIFSTHE